MFKLNLVSRRHRVMPNWLSRTVLFLAMTLILAFLIQSPQESLDLALKREMQDLREGHSSPETTTESIRNTIANLNGIYYVVSMNYGFRP